MDIWTSEEIRNKLDGTTRNNKAVFNNISSKMAEKGFQRSPKEIKNKIKNLRHDYKRVIDHTRRSGIAPEGNTIIMITKSLSRAVEQ